MYSKQKVHTPLGNAAYEYADAALDKKCKWRSLAGMRSQGDGGRKVDLESSSDP